MAARGAMGGGRAGAGRVPAPGGQCVRARPLWRGPAWAGFSPRRCPHARTSCLPSIPPRPGTQLRVRTHSALVAVAEVGPGARRPAGVRAAVPRGRKSEPAASSHGGDAAAAPSPRLGARARAGVVVGAPGIRGPAGRAEAGSRGLGGHRGGPTAPLALKLCEETTLRSAPTRAPLSCPDPLLPGTRAACPRARPGVGGAGTSRPGGLLRVCV